MTIRRNYEPIYDPGSVVLDDLRANTGTVMVSGTNYSQPFEMGRKYGCRATKRVVVVVDVGSHSIWLRDSEGKEFSLAKGDFEANFIEISDKKFNR